MFGNGPRTAAGELVVVCMEVLKDWVSKGRRVLPLKVQGLLGVDVAAEVA